MDSLVKKPIIDRAVRSILISQPKPKGDRNPYFDLAQKHNIKIDFRSFIHVEGVSPKEFRKSKVNPLDYSAIIFTSRNSIDHFHDICDALKVKMPQETKYVCSSEAVALYLQKFIQFRKRKVSFGNGRFDRMKELLNKLKSTENFLLPCSDVRNAQLPGFLEENNFKYKEAIFYRTVCSDLSDLADIFYDMIVFFSPSGLRSLYQNFPDFEQNNTRIAAFGKATREAVEEHNLRVDVSAPAPESPSMASAIDRYVTKVNAAAVE